MNQFASSPFERQPPQQLPLAMHHVLKIALVGAAVAASFAHAALQDVPSFTVPAFDYNTLQDGDAPGRVLEALQRGGIIALRNIPNYANVRERFLASAVACAVASEDVAEAERYLSTKHFYDGTRRLTLRSAAGRELLERERETLDAMAIHCPGHRELHEDFSSTLERAVDTFASVLDQTQLTLGDGERHISARKLIGDAKRLDHFHAYEAASVPSSSPRRSLSAEEIERDLSLAMHEDHGLFIAMSAPKFFSVDAKDGSIRERRLKANASGLVIGAAELDELVRPELKADELVIMMGTGASRWLETSHHLPAVMHGMRMPEEMVWDEEATPGQRNVRAWFGKMTLLPAYQRLLESKLHFDEFTNRTARHLLAEGDAEDDLKAIGCAGGRHLVESEGSCTFNICTLKPGVEKPPTVGCSQACNLDSEFFKAKCEKKCDCTGTTESDICWMVCVARLPVDECPLEDQACSGLKMICNTNATDSNSTTAPAHTHSPTTETPIPAATTSVPVSTEAPTASAPETPLSTPASPPATTTSLPTVEPASTPSLTTAAPVETLPATSTPRNEPAATTVKPSSTATPVTGTPSPSATETLPPVATASPSASEKPSTDAPAEEPVVPGGYC
jgi:hypothetical protein